MVFSSVEFLFFFLPLFLAAFLLYPANIVIALFSIAFYFVGEGWFTTVVLVSVLANFVFAKAIAATEGPARKTLLVGTVAANLLPLIYFKYTGFIADNLTLGTEAAWLKSIHLPLGISFFTFHAISYLVDVYRRHALPERSLANVAVYILLFPQLIAGPILRYKAIAPQLPARLVDWQHLYYGLIYFAFGLGQKVLIADTMAGVADPLFASWKTLSVASSWLAAITYTLQIYFDFAGYSNMAIGLAYLMGFHFPTNFDFPYWARSITEFWRRWHITLSTWFRDYVYIPLGGNRATGGVTAGNLVTVFILCGLWHGASWTFLVWGLYHGTLLVTERIGWTRLIERLPLVVSHIYTMLAVIVGWVLFRSDTFEQATGILARMAGLSRGGSSSLFEHVNFEIDVTIAAAVVLAMPPLYRATGQLVAWPAERPWPELARSAYVAGYAIAALLTILSVAKIMTGSYSPFIYFRF